MKSENYNTETNQHLEKKLKEWKTPFIQTLRIQSGTQQGAPLPPPQGS